MHFRYVEQLPIALLLTSLTVVIHGIGMSGVRRCFEGVWSPAKRRPHLIFMVGIVAIMIVTHFVEVGVWGAFYLLSGMIPDAALAIYFSIGSYTTRWARPE